MLLNKTHGHLSQTRPCAPSLRMQARQRARLPEPPSEPPSEEGSGVLRSPAPSSETCALRTEPVLRLYCPLCTMCGVCM